MCKRKCFDCNFKSSTLLCVSIEWVGVSIWVLRSSPVRDRLQDPWVFLQSVILRFYSFEIFFWRRERPLRWIHLFLSSFFRTLCWCHRQIQRLHCSSEGTLVHAICIGHKRWKARMTQAITWPEDCGTLLRPPEISGTSNISMTLLKKQALWSTRSWPVRDPDDSGMWIPKFFWEMVIWFYWKVAVLVWFIQCLFDIPYSRRPHEWDDDKIVCNVR